MNKVLPSLLGIKDVESLKKFIDIIKTEEINELHFDIMDGNFVENKCDNLEYIKLVKNAGYIANTHFMVEDPTEYIKKGIALGVDSITVHYEIGNFYKILEMLLSYKREYDIKIGISICPETPVRVLETIIDKVDIILVMSVHPGKGGQAFIDNTYERIKEIRKLSDSVRIIVDGGINDTNISEAFKCGANSVVVGNYITKDIMNAKKQINKLKSLI